MPQDTIKVNLVDNDIVFNASNYYNPLLIYKSEFLKEKELTLTLSNYEDIINGLEAKTPPPAPASPQQTKALKVEVRSEQDEKTFLINSLKDFWSEGALTSVKLFVYSDIKIIKDFLKLNQFPFIVVLSSDIETLASDYESLKNPNNFIILSTNTKTLPIFLTNKAKEELKGTVVVYNNNDNLYLKFITHYLSEASSFHAVNPYGIEVKSSVLIDDTLISSLRAKKINFYSLLNETGRDGVPAFKEGVDLAGIPIDKLFTFYYIKNEAIKELLTVFKANNRQNAKLSAMQLSGERPSVYTAVLEGFFKDLLDRNLIVSYRNINLTLGTGDNLAFKLKVTIKYNDSVNEVALEITNEDIASYLREVV